MSSDPIEVLRSVLCDPEGRVCIQGSDADREAIQSALASLSAPKPESAEAVAWVRPSALAAMNRCRNDDVNGCVDVWIRPDGEHTIPLYTAPPRPEASAPVGVEGVVKAMRMLAGVGIPVKPECVGRWADQLEALAQQPAAVEGAMVERVTNAVVGWATLPGDLPAEPEKVAELREVISTALVGQQQGGTPE